MDYTGPGDLVSGAIAFVGFRGYSRNTTGHAMTVRRGSDGASQNFDVTKGVFDLAGLRAFLVGTTGFVSKAWDQTGTGNHLVQATAANQPQIAFDPDLGGLPTLRMDGDQYLTTAGNVTQAIPYTMVAITQVFPEVSAAGVILGGTGAVTHTDGQISTGSFLECITIGGSTIGIFMPAATHHWHRAIEVNGGASSVAWMDGNSKTGKLDLTSALSTPLSIGYGDPAYDGGPPQYVGLTAEAGVWPSAFSTTQARAIQANQGAYYSLADIALPAAQFFAITQTTAPFNLPGGKYEALVSDGLEWQDVTASVTLDILGPDGTSWLPVTTAWTSDVPRFVSLPAGQYRFTIVTADTAGVIFFASVSKIPGVAP